MDVMKKLFLENAEDELEKDFNNDYEKAVKKSKLSQDEYDNIANQKWHVDKLKKEFKVRKDIMNYSNFTIKEQSEIFKKLEKDFHLRNDDTLAFLGKLAGQHLKEYVEKNRIIDDKFIDAIINSSLLDEDDKNEYYNEQKEAESRRNRNKDSESGAKDYRLALQKKVYILLLKSQYLIVGGRMRMGMVFYKYLEDSVDRHALINKYLLYRIDCYVNEGTEE